MISIEKELEKLTTLGYMNIYEKSLSIFDDSLFLHPDSIHGVSHMKRVLLHALSLATALDLDDFDTRVLAIASMYHDIGRTHDWEDDYHGDEGWKKVTKLKLLEQDGIRLHIDEALYRNDIQAIEFLIRHHCRSDKAVGKKLLKVPMAERERVEKLIKVFKDSDGLDRVRLGDLDPRYLRFPESLERIDFAVELLYSIE